MEKKKKSKRSAHVVLTSHPETSHQSSIPVDWGNSNPIKRGPIIASLTNREDRNAIGSHSGSYSVYRALATAAGSLKPDHIPDLENTSPIIDLGPHPSWQDPEKIISIDPWGADICKFFKNTLDRGVDIRPSIAVTKANINIPEIHQAIKNKRIQPDGEILTNNGDIKVTKAAIEPVWFLPGIAQRFNISEANLRTTLYEQTGGMFPELITRSDLKVLLPPNWRHYHLYFW